MTDYERGVNQASVIYQEVINDYVAENAKLRELCIDMASHLREAERIHSDELLPEGYITRMSELGIEVD